MRKIKVAKNEKRKAKRLPHMKIKYITSTCI